MKKLTNKAKARKTIFKAKPKQYKLAKRSSMLILKQNRNGHFTWGVDNTSTKGLAVFEKLIAKYHDFKRLDESSPFIYDRPVYGPDLVNYQKEKEDAIRYSKNLQLVKIVGPSGSGKTSLALAIIEELKADKDLVVGYVNFRDVGSEWELVKKYVEAMFNAMGIPDYRWGLINEENFKTTLFANCYDLPSIYAARLGKKIIAVIDDFEGIYTLPNADRIVNHFKALCKNPYKGPKNTTVLICQSSEIVKARTTSIRHPLSDFGITIDLLALDEDSWIKSIQSKFKMGGKSIEESVIIHLLEKMNRLARRVHYLCHRLYTSKTVTIRKAHVNSQINKIIEANATFYEASLGLMTHREQVLLFSLADETYESSSNYSSNTISDKLYDHLYFKDSKLTFRDPLLKAYLLKRNNIKSIRV